MRVVHILKATGIAGAERHLLTLLPGLRAHDIQAYLLLLAEPDKPLVEYAAAFEACGVPVERLTIQRHIDLLLIWRLREHLRRLQPTVVHTHLIHADLHGTLAARAAGIPRVVSSRHNDDAFRYRLPVRALNAAFWRLTDAGIAISDALVEFSIAVEGAPSRKLHRIHYGLAALSPLPRQAARIALRAERGLPQEALIIGLVCRLVEQKGVAYALRAFAQIAADFPDAHLVIAGDGPLRAALEQQASGDGLANRVHFLGWRADASALMAAFDVFVQPSLWEGFGLVLLEAMAQQIPVIASAVSAIPEIVLDWDTGLLVPPKDALALAFALRQLLTDEPLRTRLGVRGYERLQKDFSPERMVEQTAALYHRLGAGL